jgi:hypothetical protein
MTEEPSEMRKVRSLKFKMLRITTMQLSEFKTKVKLDLFIKNGISSMLTNTQMNQRRVNLTRTSVSMFKDHSTLSLLCHQEDMLILSITETWLSKLQMLETLKYGISIKDLKPSRLSSTISHGTSRTQEELTTCKCGALTMDGSNTSSMTDHSSAMFKKAANVLVFINQRMLKPLKLESRVEITRLSTKNGRSFMLIRLKLEPKDSTRTLDSTSIDHSTLSQDSQCTE